MGVNVKKHWTIVIAILLILNVIFIYINLSGESEIEPLIEQTVSNSKSGIYEGIRTSIFTEAELAELADKLPNLANSINVRLPGVNYFMTRNESGNINKYELTFTVDGSYENIRGFIYKIETYPKYMRIDSLTLNKANGDGSNISIAMKVSLYSSNGYSI